jgi:hypothetical protein
MYPNLYYVFKDWFGVDWKGLSLFNTFGLMVALSFFAAAYLLFKELQRKEKAGLMSPREEAIVVGEGASWWDLISQALVGFIFGYKIFGAFFNRLPDTDMQHYVFSKEGNLWGGLLAGILLAAVKWREKQKTHLAKPEKRIIRIWPHDRVGDFVILAMVFGILGAKIFDNLEHFDEFIMDPLGKIFSASGLTFYGGLITAAVAICLYANKKGISVKHLTDAAAPGLMIAYAIGRIGCQVAGDGDWGIFNSAYTADEKGHVMPADPATFRQRLAKDSTYFLQGKVIDADGTVHYVTDRSWPSLNEVPQAAVKGSMLPDWFFAYSYPGNVNRDGIVIPGNEEDHNRMIPQPVFPAPIYETAICLIFFLILWAVRKKIKAPLMMFGLYLTLNGLERYFVEKVRVNQLYEFMGFHFSQASGIAVGLIAAGLGLILFSSYRSAAR